MCQQCCCLLSPMLSQKPHNQLAMTFDSTHWREHTYPTHTDKDMFTFPRGKQRRWQVYTMYIEQDSYSKYITR